MTYRTLRSIYNYLAAYLGQHGYPPMRTEIAADCRLSLSLTDLALDLLELQGSIRRTPALELVTPPTPIGKRRTESVPLAS